MGDGVRRWNVYVIEIMPKWYPIVAVGLPDGKRCYYVGQTSKDLTERYKEHRTGRTLGDERFNRPGKVFKTMREAQGGATLRRNVDTALRRTMTEHYGPLDSQDAAIELENLLTDELRLRGNAVYPKNNGTMGIPFDSYRL